MTTTTPNMGTLETVLRAILSEVTPGQRPYSSDSYLPAHLVEAAQAALASNNQAAHQPAQISQALDALRKANAMHLTGSNEAAIDLERQARMILAGSVKANDAATATHQHAHNALSTAAWHIARGEAPLALTRLRRAQSHIMASMEGGV